ncbi:MAG: glycosyltransferase family 39 protein, partial [Acidobacteria bacterium]|nr:glycosyltransferase family 39 protein [Acidobacteriota bacterium]MDW7985393.1 glycosyltransferase family 39 protein [Acidobacteriota bacterium]
NDADFFAKARILARLPSVIFGVLLVLWVFLLGRALWGPTAGLWAALLTALTSGLITFGHFAVPHVPAISLATLSLYLLVRAVQVARWGLWAAGVVVAGLAASTLYNMVALAVPVFVALTFFAVRPGGDRAGQAWGRWVLRWLAGGIVALGLWVGAFLAGTPYALREFRNFWVHGVLYQYRFAMTEEGGQPLPFSWPQHLLNLIHNQGLPLFLLSGVGAVLSFPRWRDPAARPRILLYAWVLPYFLYIGTSRIYPPARYILPIVPALNVLAGALADRMWQAPRGRRWLRAGVGLTVLYTLGFALMTDWMFLHDTRAQATAWFGRLPAGTRVAAFHLKSYLPRFRSDFALEMYDTFHALADLWHRPEGPTYVVLSQSSFARFFIGMAQSPEEKAALVRLFQDPYPYRLCRVFYRHPWVRPPLELMLRPYSWKKILEWLPLNPEPEFVSPPIVVFCRPMAPPPHQ